LSKHTALGLHEKGILKFITCGSVDDGKSTLTGRLLRDSGQLFTDQQAQLDQRGAPLSHIVDGLKAEQEQGITIDVAYRYFATARRKFIVADTPGHEQYTRNMATGASNCDLALILIDAGAGLKTQTLRHSLICSLLGISHVLVIVNKMDTVGYCQTRYKEIQAAYLQATGALGFTDVRFVPVSALHGDNVVHPSTKLSWFRGTTLLDYLESLQVDSEPGNQAFRFPVQRVCLAEQGFRGYSGTIAAGEIHKGDAVRVLPSGRVTTVSRIVTFDGDLEQASSPSPVTLTLSDQLDISRGDMIVHKDALCHVSRQFRATVIWLSDQALISDKQYLLKLHHKQCPASVTRIHAGIDVNSGAEYACTTLSLNAVGQVDIALQEAIAFDVFTQNKHTGGFILIDRISGETVGAGTISQPLPEQLPEQLPPAESLTSKPTASASVIWLTGLSGAGKTTIARAISQLLDEQQISNYLLDGDELRQGLSADLGYDQNSRTENVRRAAEVAKMLCQSGVTVIVALMSPLRADRALAREINRENKFAEVFVDTPLDVCQQRDPKQLYQRAANGEVSNISGLDAPYEAPESPEIHVFGTGDTVSAIAAQIVNSVRT